MPRVSRAAAAAATAAAGGGAASAPGAAAALSAEAAALRRRLLASEAAAARAAAARLLDEALAGSSRSAGDAAGAEGVGGGLHAARAALLYEEENALGTFDASRCRLLAAAAEGDDVLRRMEADARRRIEIALQDALVWELIAFTEPGTCFDAALEMALGLSVERSLRSKLLHCYHLKMRCLVAAGEYLVECSTVRPNSQLIRRGGLRRRRRGVRESVLAPYDHVSSVESADSDTLGLTREASEIDDLQTEASPVREWFSSRGASRCEEDDNEEHVPVELVTPTASSVDVAANMPWQARWGSHSWYDHGAARAEDVPVRNTFIHFPVHPRRLGPWAAQKTSKQNDLEASLGQAPRRGRRYGEGTNDSESSHSKATSLARQSAPGNLQAWEIAPPPGLGSLCRLQNLAQGYTSLERLLEAALVDMGADLEALDSSSAGAADQQIHARQAVAESAERWRKRRLQDTDGSCAHAAAWIRMDDERHDGHGGGLRRKRRALVVSLVLSVEPLLTLLESTADAVFSLAVYRALAVHTCIRDLAPREAKKVVQTVLMTEDNIYSFEWYSAMIVLMGRILRGMAREEKEVCWAKSVGVPSVRWAAGSETLLDQVIVKVLQTAGWWHRSRFHTEDSVALLRVTFSALSNIFEGASSFGPWNDQIWWLANNFQADYHSVSAAIEASRTLTSVCCGFVGANTTEFATR